MAASLAPEVLADELALSLARVLAAANRCARAQGVDVGDSLITVTQTDSPAGTLWRVNYGPRNYVGRRGGDLIVEVEGGDTSIRGVIRGQ